MIFAFRCKRETTIFDVKLKKIVSTLKSASHLTSCTIILLLSNFKHSNLFKLL